MTGTNCFGSRALSTRAVQRSSFASVGVLPEGFAGVVVEVVIRTIVLIFWSIGLVVVMLIVGSGVEVGWRDVGGGMDWNAMRH